MLCNTYNGDDIQKCSVRNEFYHFMRAVLKETSFRKMSIVAQQKRFYNKCKYNVNTPFPIPDKNTEVNNVYSNMSTSSNDSFKNLTDSVNFVSDKLWSIIFSIFNLIIRRKV